MRQSGPVEGWRKAAVLGNTVGSDWNGGVRQERETSLLDDASVCLFSNISPRSDAAKR